MCHLRYRAHLPFPVSFFHPCWDKALAKNSEEQHKAKRNLIVRLNYLMQHSLRQIQLLPWQVRYESKHEFRNLIALKVTQSVTGCSRSHRNLEWLCFSIPSQQANHHSGERNKLLESLIYRNTYSRWNLRLLLELLVFYCDVWKPHNNIWRTFIKISETHALCICFNFTSQGSLELHTQNASASAKRVLELPGSQPNRHWSSCTIAELLYFCSGQTGKKYSAGKLARELKDNVYQQQVVHLWNSLC